MTSEDFDALALAAREAIHEARARWEIHEAVDSVARARGLELEPHDAWDLIRTQVPDSYPDG